MRLWLSLLIACAACNSADNLIFGGAAAGTSTPEVVFPTIGSSIHGLAHLRDSSGNPIGDPMAIVIMSDQDGLCSTLHQKPDYFRNSPAAYEALVMIVRQGYLGTFVVGRASDPGTAAEIVAAGAPAQTPSPFHALATSYIALTNWSTSDNATGSFNLLMDDPNDPTIEHGFYGRFKSDYCSTLDGVLLP
jgi:hypothetical protein